MSLDNSQFRKKEESLFWNNFSYVWIGICFGIMIGAIIVSVGILYDGNFIKKSDCPVNIQPVEMPKIICSNYSIIGDYYYCNIDDVEVRP